MVCIQPAQGILAGGAATLCLVCMYNRTVRVQEGTIGQRRVRRLCALLSAILLLFPRCSSTRVSNTQHRTHHPHFVLASAQLESGSHVVNTAWAMMALLAASYHKHDPKPLHAAARYLMNMQESSGDWPQQTISGVFNRNCMITYTNYR